MFNKADILSKVKLTALFLLLSIFTFTMTNATQTSWANDTKSPKLLVVYYSLTGNTKNLAEEIQKQTGADIFEIQTNPPYPSDYAEVSQRVKAEINDGIRPKLANNIPNIDDYDVVFLGSPNWLGSISLPMASFLEANDLSAKTIAPFITHGGGGMSRTVSDITTIAPNAKQLSPLLVKSANINNSKELVTNWLNEINIAQ